ncbi:MAG: hypothetical protein FWG82_02935 [Oscillospiraceae bacterium]|nr:hypothetical protein [Oscillospiraceae bacterium]
MKKRFFSVTIVMCLLLTSLSIPAFAGTLEVDWQYESVDMKWGSELFAGSSTVYNPDLAKASLPLIRALLQDGSRPHHNRQAVYDNFGFKNTVFHYNNSYSPPLVIGSQTMRINGVNTQLILVGIRGNASFKEWLNSFYMMSSDYYGHKVHSGFKNNADEVWDTLNGFLTKNQNLPQNKKFLVTGFSSGSAAANLLALRLEKEGLAKKDDIFMYAFATPNYISGNPTAGHENFFNFVCNEDIVTQIPPNTVFGSWSKLGSVFSFGINDTDPHSFNNYMQGISNAQLVNGTPSFSLRFLTDWIVLAIKSMFTFSLVR